MLLACYMCVVVVVVVALCVWCFFLLYYSCSLWVVFNFAKTYVHVGLNYYSVQVLDIFHYSSLDNISLSISKNAEGPPIAR